MDVSWLLAFGWRLVPLVRVEALCWEGVGCCLWALVVVFGWDLGGLLLVAINDSCV